MSENIEMSKNEIPVYGEVSGAEGARDNKVDDRRHRRRRQHIEMPDQLRYLGCTERIYRFGNCIQNIKNAFFACGAFRFVAHINTCNGFSEFLSVRTYYIQIQIA